MAHPVTITRAQPRDTPRLQPTQLAPSMCACVCVHQPPTARAADTSLSLSHSIHPSFVPFPPCVSVPTITTLFLRGRVTVITRELVRCRATGVT